MCIVLSLELLVPHYTGTRGINAEDIVAEGERMKLECEAGGRNWLGGYCRLQGRQWSPSQGSGEQGAD